MNTRTYQNHQIYVVPAALSSLFLLTLYLATMPRGLTWDLGGADGGELAAAAFSGGLVHSPGYPTWLILAKIPLLIPIQPIGLRLNIFSALTAALSGGILVYVTGIYLRPTTRWLTVLSAVVWGTHFQIWSQAVITEVYALAALFAVGILLTAVRPIISLDQKYDYYWLFLFGLFTGLGMGSHYFVALVALFAGGLIWLESNSLKHGSNWAWMVLGLALGLLVFLYLPFAAGTNLVSNWGNPDTLERFIWVVSGAAFSDRFNPDVSLFQFGSLVGHTVREFGYISLAFAVLGLVTWYSSARRRVWLIGGLTATNIYLVAGYNSADTLPYLYPLLVILSLATVAGLDYLIQSSFKKLPDRRIASWVAIVLVGGIVLGARFRQNGNIILAAQPAAEAFAAEIIPTLEPNSIVFSDDGRKSFALRYGLAVHDRDDVVPVDVSLLFYDWYRADLAQQLSLPEAEFVSQVSKQNPQMILTLLGEDHDRPIVVLEESIVLK
ncbi:MAG: DUF2723 domain-containing protein [Anaerolineae bacterium]